MRLNYFFCRDPITNIIQLKQAIGINHLHQILYLLLGISFVHQAF